MPEDFEVPGELDTGTFRLVPLGPEHNEADYRAWSSSIEHISSTPGFKGRPWPRSGMTLLDNLADLQRHAVDFAARSGFTYTVLDRDSGEVIGCVYIYPRAAGGAEVRSWVRADRAELDVPLYEAVRDWLQSDWPFTAITYAPR